MEYFLVCVFKHNYGVFLGMCFLNILLGEIFVYDNYLQISYSMDAIKVLLFVPQLHFSVQLITIEFLNPPYLSLIYQIFLLSCS